MSFDLATIFADMPVPNSDTKQAITKIDVDNLISNEANFYEVRDLGGLMDSIALCGLMDPPTVTPIADQPGKYRLISGHRRTAAIRALVDGDGCEKREDLRMVPCFVRESRSAALEELELIYANSTTRVLTSPEVMRQAERVERLLYDLKNEGVEFPGRMRDHVAEACKVSKSKLARLKVIRDLLPPKFMPAFDAGELSEEAAYTIARLPVEIKVVVEDMKQAKMIADCAKQLLNNKKSVYTAPEFKCKDGSDCDNTLNFILKTASSPTSWNACRETCCVKCCYTDCRYACKTAKDNRAAEKAKADKHEQSSEIARKRESRKIEKIIRDFWTRLQPAIEVSGLKFKDAAALILEPYNVSTLEKIMAGTFDGVLYSTYGFILRDNDKIQLACKKIGCSADFLFGLSDTKNSAVLESAPTPWVNAADDLPDGDYIVMTQGGTRVTNRMRWHGQWYLPMDRNHESPLENYLSGEYCATPITMCGALDFPQPKNKDEGGNDDAK